MLRNRISLLPSFLPDEMLTPSILGIAGSGQKWKTSPRFCVLTREKVSMKFVKNIPALGQLFAQLLLLPVAGKLP
jgi:hypothetical protein